MAEKIRKSDLVLSLPKELSCPEPAEGLAPLEILYRFVQCNTFEPKISNGVEK